MGSQVSGIALPCGNFCEMLRRFCRFQKTQTFYWTTFDTLNPLRLKMVLLALFWRVPIGDLPDPLTASSFENYKNLKRWCRKGISKTTRFLTFFTQFLQIYDQRLRPFWRKVISTSARSISATEARKGNPAHLTPPSDLRRRGTRDRHNRHWSRPDPAK